MISEIALRVLLRGLEKVRYGALRLQLPNGTWHEFCGDMPGPRAEMTLHSSEVVLNMMRRGDVGLCDDYRAARWDSPDPALLVEFGLRNVDAIGSLYWGSPVFRLFSRVSYLLNINTRQGSRRNIAAHYDLGNDFYSLWLDPSMTYSAALFADRSESLESAQCRKYDRILDVIGRDGERVLEIGCGWGGFAERLAACSGRDLRSITISPAQHRFASARMEQFQPRVDVALEDYRDTRGKYGSIVSIEMFEAVGEQYWRTYFERVSNLLRRGGRAMIQSITIGDEYFKEYRRCADLFRTYIFPGGLLPSPERFAAEATRVGLRLNDSFSFGQDYATTCEHWRARFHEREKEIENLGYDEGFRRLWSFYLSTCIGAFRAGRIDVRQFELQHA